ncbi:porin family protein [Kaustia mangrovi]|uniref:Porin family protein n=1 Tax=Kaustia mangrovi TaxID=2593653 RepID=A0A7S8HDV9_9HYPH|nr:outer membrane protein [Kaustia mangrovi]QPC45060.1 porin family protein [Kaustia mangrovi]
MTGTAAMAVAIGSYAAPHAHAADLPVYTPPPPVPVWSWTGPYAGLHVGTVDGDLDGDMELTGTSVSSSANMDPNGIMGGLQVGYNYQFDSVVVGLEGDIGFGDVDDVIYPDSLVPRIESRIDWMATIRGRLGWAWDRTLFYVTGGVAFADVKIKSEFSFSAFDDSDSDRETLVGWTVGGGVEHALTDNISLKAEYLYADLGKKTFRYSPTIFGSAEDWNSDMDLKTHTFRVGVNWLF